MSQSSLANYQVLRVLGKGGMGTVYLAKHKELGHKVAIKELKPQFARDPLIRSRFQKEASLMSNLSHPGIVALYDYIETNESVYIILEYIEGITLDYYIHSVSGPIPEVRAVEVFSKILDAVAYAHQRGVVHRDLKPANIMISPVGNIKVLDFGIAKNIYDKGDEQLTQVGMRMGTIYYMSPEQIRAQELDQRSDIYSLGICLFEMVAAQNPYIAETSEFDISQKIVNEPLPPARQFYAKVSERIQKIISKATAKNPSARFQNISEFKQALEQFSEFAREANRPSPTVEWIIQPLKNNREPLPKDNEPALEQQSPEHLILKNQFGHITNQRISFYRGRDLFEKGESSEIALKLLISAEIKTHQETISGIVFLVLTALILWFFFHWIGFILSVFLLSFAGICFAKFPTITLVRKDLKKVRMRGWPWHIWSAKNYTYSLQDALDRRE
jgi:serine/threonine protein kinase